MTHALIVECVDDTYAILLKVADADAIPLCADVLAADPGRGEAFPRCQKIDAFAGHHR